MNAPAAEISPAPSWSLEAPVRRLAALAPLSEADVALLRRLLRRGEMIPAKMELFAEGEPVRRPLLMLSGWACRQRILLDGRRQILSFILPGDLIELRLWPDPAALSSVATLSAALVADATPLREAIEDRDPEHAHLAAACAIAIGMEEKRLGDQVTRLGRQTAYERVAHLLLEIHERLAAAGLADGLRFPLPLTQETLADALGLSIVHVNRTLQHLRRDGLMELKSGIVTLREPVLLGAIADFRSRSVSCSSGRRRRRKFAP